MPNEVSLKEHLEAIVSRMETSVKEQIGGLREDISNLKSILVTRAEYEIQTDNLKQEIKRIESESRERARNSERRFWLVAGLVFAAAQAVMAYLG